MKGLWAKKFAKMKKQKDSESSDDQSGTRVREIQSSGFHQIEETSSELGEPNQVKNFIPSKNPKYKEKYHTGNRFFCTIC